MRIFDSLGGSIFGIFEKSCFYLGENTIFHKNELKTRVFRGVPTFPGPSWGLQNHVFFEVFVFFVVFLLLGSFSSHLTPFWGLWGPFWAALGALGSILGSP